MSASWVLRAVWEPTLLAHPYLAGEGGMLGELAGVPGEGWESGEERQARFMSLSNSSV